MGGVLHGNVLHGSRFRAVRSWKVSAADTGELEFRAQRVPSSGALAAGDPLATKAQRSALDLETSFGWYLRWGIESF